MGTLTVVRRRWNWLISWWLVVVLELSVSVTNSQNLFRQTTVDGHTQADLPSLGVQLVQQAQHVVMSNGIVNITLTVPGGAITSITYKGSENLLQTQNKEDERAIEGTSYKVIIRNENQTEISFTRTWKVGSSNVPLNVDKRFHYMAMSDERQRFMPMPEDRKNGQVLQYKEAVLLTNPINPDFKGEVDDKYLYSCDNKDNKVHGWVSSDRPSVGFWLITPSNEFRTGGPLTQDLTSHVGPVTLAKFSTTHYAGEDLAIKFQTEENWKKVIGPFFIYLNSNASANANPSMQKEVNSWPYNFPLSKDFVKSNQRGAVRGQLLVQDRFINKRAVPGASAYVGLAPPGAAGSWQLENKVLGFLYQGYQFWTQTDRNGSFLIKNVIPGNYSLFAWVPGIIGDYKHPSDITITPGSNVVARNVVFEAPRKGPTLWEIGIPDRSAAEFFIPDPDPKYKIHQYKVRFNDPKSPPHFSTGPIGKDNALARHGIRGIYRFYSIRVADTHLVVGRNTIFLTQAKAEGPFKEVMYDYIRLEGPA
ncbi:hypothetical protein DH2020_015249 [Rehmannia glutinosa]|uniref:rhamnogalacturonan endolyase n=1 Tax=Rehmannia glutinosa TaxID=99300 RepID=A0ABR0WS32_REHGL